jgi:AcrR family transcriptional regulator
MATDSPATPDERPRLGRPPRISRQMIAEAAHELGLDGLTLRKVADHLGVSIAALYHHVSSKDDLMRVAAEYSVARVPRPEDRGQHWAQWLAEWAEYNLDAFVTRPGLLTQYMEGGITAEVIAGNLDTILGVLVRQEFTVLEANAAYELVTSCALGMAVGIIRDRESEAAGLPIRVAYQRLLAERDPGDLPHLRELVGAVAEHGREPFAAQIATVLDGVAARLGVDPAEVRQALRGPVSHHPRS